MTRLLTALTLVALAVTACAQVEVPPEIDQALTDMHDSLVIGDVETAQSYLTKLALVQAKLASQGNKRGLLSLNDVYVLDSLEREYIKCLSADDVVAVEYDLTITGMDKKSGEDRTEVWRCGDAFTLTETGWKVSQMMRFDVDRAAALIKGCQLKDEAHGIEATLPASWETGVADGMASLAVVMMAPDLHTGGAIVCQDLPVTLTAKQLAQAEQKSLGLFGGSSIVVEEGETTLGGKPGYQMMQSIVMEEDTVYTHRTYTVVSTEDRNMLYGLVFSSQSKEGLETYAKERAAVAKSLKITEPGELVLPPELGRIADGGYLNPTYEFQMDIPEGWKGSIGLSRFLFQFTAKPPEGDSSILAGALEIGQWVDPKDAGQGDLNGLRQQAQNVNVVAQESFMVDEISAYKHIVEFELAEGATRKRLQAFFSKDTRLYFLVCDAVPATEYANVEQAFNDALDSVTFGPVAEE